MLPLPIQAESPRQAWAWGNGLLVLLIVAGFIAQRIDPRLLAFGWLDLHNSDLWRFCTYAFLHAGWGHLLANLLMLHIFGRPVNDRLGQVGLVAFYLAGAVFAALVCLLSGGQKLIGASGAIGAVLGAYLAFLPTSRITLLILFGTLRAPAMAFVLAFFLYNLLMSLAGGAFHPVAYLAHLAGLAFGFAVGMLLLALGLVPRQPQDLLALLQKRPPAMPAAPLHPPAAPPV